MLISDWSSDVCSSDLQVRFSCAGRSQHQAGVCAGQTSPRVQLGGAQGVFAVSRETWRRKISQSCQPDFRVRGRGRARPWIAQTREDLFTPAPGCSPRAKSAGKAPTFVLLPTLNAWTPYQQS